MLPFSCIPFITATEWQMHIMPTMITLSFVCYDNRYGTGGNLEVLKKILYSIAWMHIQQGTDDVESNMNSNALRTT